jgi:hypothetical protein
VRTAIYMAGAFVIGIAMAKLLELPVLRFRDRMFPSRGGNAISSAPQVAEPAIPARRHAA